MKKLLMLIALIGITCSAQARQYAPARDISINTGTVYQIITTEDDMQEVIETFDAEISSLQTNDVSTLALIAGNTSNITVNADAITATESNTTVNADAITATVSNTTDNADAIVATDSNVVINADLIADIQGGAVTGMVWAAVKASNLAAGSADTQIELADYAVHTANTLTNGFDLATGRFTVPRDGVYLFCGSVSHQDDATPDEWVAYVIKNSASSWIIDGQTQAGAGVIASAVVFRLVTGDYVSLWVKHSTSALSGSIYIEQSNFSATYLGE